MVVVMVCSRVAKVLSRIVSIFDTSMPLSMKRDPSKVPPPRSTAFLVQSVGDNNRAVTIREDRRSWDKGR